MGDMNQLRAELFVLSECPDLDLHQIRVLDATIKVLGKPIDHKADRGGWFLYFFVGYLGFAIGLIAGLLVWR